MNKSEETEVRKTSRWIEEEEAKTEIDTEDKNNDILRDIEDLEEKPKKKKSTYLQIPVIISICLVIASLLGYFTYKSVLIKEPEGVIWEWVSDDDTVWYYEFKEDNIVKIYSASYEITSDYIKDKDSGKTNKLSLPFPTQLQLGCFVLDEEIDYSVSGIRIAGDQRMTISYSISGEDHEYELSQVSERENVLDLPEDFSADEDLLGEWTNYASSNGVQYTLAFYDDGSCKLNTIYDFDDGTHTEICRNNIYTVDSGELHITYMTDDTNVESYQYSVKDDILYLDGTPIYYRTDSSPSTPDQQ